jgi:hypothetical protein
MYFAGIISDMTTEEEFERWMDGAYFYMASDYIVAVSLAETDFAQDLADKWIASGEELRMSAGWSCYCWLLGNRPDSVFSADKLAAMLDRVEKTIHDAPDRTKISMNNFVYTVAVSYVPLHEKAVLAAKAVGPVEIRKGQKNSKTLLASEMIQKEIDRGRIGFKRKYVRC